MDRRLDWVGGKSNLFEGRSIIFHGDPELFERQNRAQQQARRRRTQDARTRNIAENAFEGVLRRNWWKIFGLAVFAAALGAAGDEIIEYFTSQ